MNTPPPGYEEPKTKPQKYTQNYNYTEPFENTNKQPITKTLVYAISALVLVGGIVFVIIKFMSSATEKYYVNVKLYDLLRK